MSLHCMLWSRPQYLLCSLLQILSSLFLSHVYHISVGPDPPLVTVKETVVSSYDYSVQLRCQIQSEAYKEGTTSIRWTDISVRVLYIFMYVFLCVYRHKCYKVFFIFLPPYRMGWFQLKIIHLLVTFTVQTTVMEQSSSPLSLLSPPWWGPTHATPLMNVVRILALPWCWGPLLPLPCPIFLPVWKEVQLASDGEGPPPQSTSRSTGSLSIGESVDQ